MSKNKCAEQQQERVSIAVGAAAMLGAHSCAAAAYALLLLSTAQHSTPRHVTQHTLSSKTAYCPPHASRAVTHPSQAQ